MTECTEHFWVKDGDPTDEDFYIYKTKRGKRWPHFDKIKVTEKWGTAKRLWRKQRFYCAKCRKEEVQQKDFFKPEDSLKEGYAVGPYSYSDSNDRYWQWPELTTDEYEEGRKECSQSSTVS